MCYVFLSHPSGCVGSGHVPGGPLRRHLALAYCELTGREMEYVSLSRDTTETDLKQRREIVAGTVHYVDQVSVYVSLCLSVSLYVTVCVSLIPIIVHILVLLAYMCLYKILYIQYRSDARYNERALRTRLHEAANAFTQGSERDHTRTQTRSHEEANAFARGSERVSARQRTRSHANANAFTRGGERGRTRTRTRSHEEANALK